MFFQTGISLIFVITVFLRALEQITVSMVMNTPPMFFYIATLFTSLPPIISCTFEYCPISNVMNAPHVSLQIGICFAFIITVFLRAFEQFSVSNVVNLP